MPRFFPPIPCNGFIRVRFAVEDEDAAVLRQTRRFEQIEREGWPQVPLKTLHPGFRPPGDFASRVGHESLLGVELAPVLGAVHFLEEGLVDGVGLRAGIEAKNRGVAHLWAATKQVFPPVHPVVDDAEFARFVVEKAVHCTGDDEVQVEEEGRAVQSAESIFREHKLHQDVRPV